MSAAEDLGSAPALLFADDPPSLGFPPPAEPRLGPESRLPPLDLSLSPSQPRSAAQLRSSFRSSDENPLAVEIQRPAPRPPVADNPPSLGLPPLAEPQLGPVSKRPPLASASSQPRSSAQELSPTPALPPLSMPPDQWGGGASWSFSQPGPPSVWTGYRRYAFDPAAVFSTVGAPSTATFRPTARLYSQQWHLSAIGDMERLWAEYRGKGVKVGVFDEGMEATHPGLAANYDKSLEYKSYNGNNGGRHGTAVAGLIAGTADGPAMGVAFEATIASVPILGRVPFANETFEWMAQFDVVNNSWGPINPFGYSNGMFDAFLNAAVTKGRGDLGTIVVESAGNTRDNDGNFNSFARTRYSLTVGALQADGDVASFSTRGACVLVSAPGVSLTTTDVTGAGGYTPSDATTNFSGTSGAAPIVSGVVALMLSANPLLGWRDVQEILAITADHTTPSDLGSLVPRGNMRNAWTINGAKNVNGGGLHFSNDVGFGQVDAFEAVRMAEVWSKFGPAQTSANEGQASFEATETLTPRGTEWSYSFTLTTSLRLEHVDPTIGFFTANKKFKLSNLFIELVSPDGTVSKLSDYNSVFTSNLSQPNVWTYGSEAFRGELSAGTWTIRLSSYTSFDPDCDAMATLDLYGSAPGTNDVYHFTDEFRKMLALDPRRAIVTDTNGGVDWINAAALRGNLNLDLCAGAASTLDGESFITIAAGTTIENAVTGDGNDTVTGNGGDNVLCGMRGNDLLRGGAGKDTLEGGQDNDTLYGDGGDDVLDGGAGRNDLFGGAGADIFRFTKTSTTQGCTSIIEDFTNGQDIIDLSGLGFTFRDLQISRASGLVGSTLVEGLVVELSTGGAMWLRGVSTLNEADFRFY